MSDRAWIVLPTYNESFNLAGIVASILQALPDATVLVVDDNSPDGTGDIADHLAENDPRVRVLHRPGKGGLGPAYVAGFGEALAAGAGYVIEMDADFSHNPLDLPRLLAEARDGADLVLGSRYVPGGGVENWGAGRRLVSRAGCVYARSLLGVPVRDLTGGFKCFRAGTLEAIDYRSVRSLGYAFQVELTYRTLMRGLKVREIPIVFRERREGQSKMTGQIALEAAWLVPRLRAAHVLARRRRRRPV